MTRMHKDIDQRAMERFAVGVNQVVAVGAASAATTNPVGAMTTLVRLISTTACHIKIAKQVGETPPAATTSDPLLPANVPWEVAVRPGDKVAALRVSQDGNLHVTEMV